MATTHNTQLARVVAGTLAVFLYLTVTPLARAYGWPVKPFDRQHPVRAFFGDPRIGEGGVTQFHFGIDVAARNGTPVYATISGTVSLLHPDVVVVHAAGGVEFSYWHVVPSVRPGAYARAYTTVVGRVEAPWAHVHFSEARYGRYLNPLRPGALAPFADHGLPRIARVSAEARGRNVAMTRAAGTIDLVVEAYDETPLKVFPEWWSGLPVMPAYIRWRIVSDAGRVVTAWATAIDFRTTLPPASVFGSVFAPATQQNHARRPGRYAVYLTRSWRTTGLSDGAYRVEVIAGDVRGNEGRAVFAVVVANHGTGTVQR
jgi:peptidase M23-like protein